MYDVHVLFNDIPGELGEIAAALAASGRQAIEKHFSR